MVVKRSRKTGKENAGFDINPEYDGAPNKDVWLRGPKVHLRLLEEFDLPLLVKWRNDPRNWQQFFNRFPLSQINQRSWFQSLLDNPARKFFMVCLAKGKAVGTFSFDQIDPINLSLEVGNVLIGEHTHKGLASEALELLVNFAFVQLNMHRLYLEVWAGNLPAIGLYRKFGFELEGVARQARYSDGKFRDIAHMGLLKEDWMALRMSGKRR
ncbi:MAG: acetyltransferase, family [Fibrobacteres bacterium]|nr:acetyltransferase, family [Fibrobacterota bacterium]